MMETGVNMPFPLTAGLERVHNCHYFYKISNQQKLPFYLYNQLFYPFIKVL